MLQGLEQMNKALSGKLFVAKRTLYHLFEFGVLEYGMLNRFLPVIPDVIVFDLEHLVDLYRPDDQVLHLVFQEMRVVDAKIGEPMAASTRDYSLDM
jgi:hypothetical protein